MNKKTFKEQAQKALAKCKITNNNDGTINITGNLKIKFPLKYLPKIKKLDGIFDCRNNFYLTSLKNSPTIVTGEFMCSNCTKLKTLKGAPTNVVSYFDCSHCTALKTLKHAPQIIKGAFFCEYCTALKTLKGAPKTIGSNFYCNNCKSLIAIAHSPFLPNGKIHHNQCKLLSPKEKTDWIKKQASYKKRESLEKSLTNQNESTWKHLI